MHESFFAKYSNIITYIRHGSIKYIHNSNDIYSGDSNVFFKMYSVLQNIYVCFLAMAHILEGATNILDEQL